MNFISINHTLRNRLLPGPGRLHTVSVVELHFCRTTLPSGHLRSRDAHPQCSSSSCCPAPRQRVVLSPTEGGSRAGTQGAVSPQLRLGSTVCWDRRPHGAPQVHGEPSSSHSPLPCPTTSRSDVTTLILIRDKADVASSSVNTHGLVVRPGPKEKGFCVLLKKDRNLGVPS